jgi:hypothetical protein
MLARRRTGLSKRTVSKRTVLTQIGDPVEPREGKRATSEALTRNFRWAVRHYLGGETLEALAAESQLHPSVLSKAIRKTIELLPEEAVADKKFRGSVSKLREAAKMKGAV